MLRDSFLYYLFGGKTQADKSSRYDSGRRALNLEPLEDRHMLSVSFDSPLVSTYESDSSSVAVNPNLDEHRLLLSGDFNNDTKTDILAIENSKAYTYLNNSSLQNGFDPAKLATNSLLTIMRADVGKVTGGTNLDLIGVSATDNVIKFSVFGGRGNGGFYDVPVAESSWTGLPTLLSNRGVVIPTGGSLHSYIGDIFLVENNSRTDLICTVVYSVLRADSSLYSYATVNLLFTNNGSGQFTTAPSAIETGNAEIIAAGDLTGDSKPDYVTRNAQDQGKLDIYLNNGTKITTGTLGYQIGQVVVAKCHTGDKMEIIAALKDAAGNNYLRVVTVSGTSVSLSAQYAVDIVPINIVTGTFDNDSRLDIFISDGSIHQTLLGQSDGKFQKQNAVIANADFMAVHSADFDGDGKIDVLAVGKRFAWLIPGDTSKSPSVAVDFTSMGITPKDIAFGDFNGDGKTDFAVLNHVGDEVHVFYQSSSTTNLFTKAATPLVVSNGKELLVANFDNANGDDIVIYGVDVTGRSVLQNYLSNASGGFNAVKTTTLNSGVNDVFDLLTVGDVHGTGDGYIDIVAIYNGSTGTTTTRNSYYQVLEYVASDGSFKIGTKGDVPGAANPTAVALADINGDNKNDIVILDATSKSVWVLPQATAPGTFWNNTNMKSYQVTGLTVDSAAFSQLAIADFNFDGLNDVLVGVWTTSGNLTFRVLENDPTNKGTLKLSETNITTTENNFVGTNASGLAFHVGRLDDNGTPDVVFVGGNTVKRFLNSDKSGAEIGTVTLVFRDYINKNELTYIDEWSTFYVEIWANTGSATAGIKSYEAVLAFDAGFFEVRFEEVFCGTAFSNLSFTKGSGQITVSGTVSGTGLQGNNTDVLLGYVAFRPSSDTRSVALDYSYGPKPIDNGFALQKTTLVSSTNVTGQAKFEVTNQVPLFPVNYDINGDGRINAQDFAIFANYYSMNISSPLATKNILFCNFNSSSSSAQTIDAQDFARFAQNYGLTKKDCRANPALKVEYHNSYLNQPIPAGPAIGPAMAAFVSEVVEDILDGSSISESLMTSPVSNQSTQNQALMAFIASQETKNDDFDIDSLNPVSETARLIAEGKL